MVNARDRILARLQSNDYREDLAESSADAAVEFGAADLVSELRLKMEAVHTEVVETSADRFLLTLQEIVKGKGIANLLCSPDTELGAKIKHGWSDQLPQLVAYDQPIDKWKRELFYEIDAAITTTKCGIAATGSLVVWPTKSEPRLMSLVPPLHIAVLDRARIFGTFDEAIRSDDWVSVGLPTNALLISGPSKTADIEQTLAYGVHGPKELIVIIVD